MPPRQRAIFFDLMGTCCDWLSSLLPLLKSCPAHSSIDAKEVALAWRAGFFDEIHKRYTRGDPAEDINITHRRVLDRILDMKGIGEDLWSEDIRERLVQQWHMQMPWSDVIPALTKLREDKDTTWLLVVLANGTTRLQLDIAASSAIPFHTLFSSELLGLTKPDPAIYRKAMDLVRLPPLACIMLASHLYDLEAAKGVGMRTIYVHRDTEDVGEVIDPLTIVPDGKHSHVDLYFDGREGTDGFGQVVQSLMV